MTWFIRPLVIQLIRSDIYGDPYSGIVTVMCTEPGCGYVCGLLSVDPFTRADRLEIRTKLQEYGINKVSWIRIKDSQILQRPLSSL